MKEKIKGFFADMGKAIIILALILVVTVGIIMDFAGKSGSGVVLQQKRTRVGISLLPLKSQL